MNTIHVFSKEVPWNAAAATGELNTITSALNQAHPGDTIIVHEGIYRETVTITKDNLTIKNAPDDYVLVTGTEIVSHFEKAATHPTPGVMVAPVSKAWHDSTLKFSQVFIDGAMGDMARHPNRTISAMMNPLAPGSGYGEVSNIYKNADSDGHATFDGGLPDVDLVGGIFRGLIGKNRQYPIGWILENSGNSITFKGINKNHWTPDATIDVSFHKFGYGMVMHKNLIDAPGEWFVDDGYLYYLPKKADEVVEMQVREKVLHISAAELSLEGINFKAGCASIMGMNNSIIKSCSFRYLSPFIMSPFYGDGATEDTGIYISGSSHNTFEDLYVAHTWGTGISLMNGHSNLFTNCIIKDIGWIGIFTAGIFTAADKTRIENCTFEDNGRFQIRIREHGKTDIIHNEFSGAMSMSEDAGAISSESSGWIGPLDLKGSEIAYNKIHDVKGFPVSGGGYLKQFMIGIYLEDTENYTAHHNLIYDIVADNFKKDVPGFDRAGAMAYFGPRYNAMHKPIRWYNNTAWNCDKGINLWHINIENYDELRAQGMKQVDASGLMSDGIFANNIFPIARNTISYISQIITPTGSTIKFVPLTGPSKSLTTTDIDEFFTHCEPLGYPFNPQCNYMADETTFVDAKNHDFRLTETSPARNGGASISEITSSATPDAGALEGGAMVLSAGATLKVPTFKELQ